MRLPIVFAAALLLSLPFACGSSKKGRDFNFDTVRRFEVGKSTPEEVKAALGMPQTTKKGDQGIETWTYSYIVTDAHGWYSTTIDQLMKLAVFVFQNGKLADLQWMLQNMTSKGAWFSGEAGSPVGVDAMNALERGKATPQQVEAKFGVPTVRIWRHDGIEVWSYAHVKGGTTTTGTVTFRNGVLTDVKTEKK
jgi:hypothetical protein